MANIKSQKKRIRQDKKRNIRNKSIKTQLKGVLKSVENEKVENKEIAMKTLEIEINLKFQNCNILLQEIKNLFAFSGSYGYLFNIFSILKIIKRI